MRVLTILLAALFARPSPAAPTEQEMLWALSFGDPPASWLASRQELDTPAERWIALYRGRGRPLMQGALSRLRSDRSTIEAILSEHHLPAWYVAIPVAESALLRTVVSRRGAVGPWQLMAPTAHELGLVLNVDRDERTDLVASTQAAARYLSRLRRALADDDLVLAAYNEGPTAVRELLRAVGGGGYAAIADALSPEARQYVPKVHAVAEILADPAAYGFSP